ncbi:MAG: class I SAM-dependent methyltransferase [Chloroflexota bacterium]
MIDPFPLLANALAARSHPFELPREGAVRLFNGFLEGWAQLVVERYAETLVLLDHARPPEKAPIAWQEIVAFYRQALPWLNCALLKSRYANDEASRRGTSLFGEKAAREITENGVRYALDLTLNQDTSFYLDTRNLRQWAKENLAGKRVLNTFAYTGSLGVAAMAAGAGQVVHVDRNRQFLNMAKSSYTRNGFPVRQQDFRSGDFFSHVNMLKREGALFDCVFLDPPFFATTGKGRVDLVREAARLINKVRPLIADGGQLVTINNALFVSGAEYIQTLQKLCADGYLSIESLIPVPDDCIGYTQTIQRPLPADPAPFNHATKIAVLKVRRKFVEHLSQ